MNKLLKKDGKLVKQGGKLVRSADPADCPCCGTIDFCFDVAGVQIINGQPGWNYNTSEPCKPCFPDCVKKDAPAWQLNESECNAHRETDCKPVLCYEITSPPPSSGVDSCCVAGTCCNYDGTSIREVIKGGNGIWQAQDCGPARTSTWVLERNGTSWTLKNNCQVFCHIGAYEGSADNWDGQGCQMFTMRNGYPDVQVCAVDCAAVREVAYPAPTGLSNYPENPLP